MEKIIHYTNKVNTLSELVNAYEYDRIIVDFGDIDISPEFLNYILKLFRESKKLNKDIIFLSRNEIDYDLKKYFKIFKDYEQYKQLSVFTGFEVKLYMNNELVRNYLKNIFVQNGFIAKERREQNFLNKEHDSRSKDIYIVDFDSYKKEKLQEIKKIKSKNNDSIVILLIDRDSTEQALKTITLGVDSIIEKPINIDEILETVKKLSISSNLKFENRKLNEKILNLYENLQKELNLAKDIQRNLLPQENTHFNGYNIKYIFEPSQRVGGDFCDVITLDSDRLAIIFADISGHGIPASLLSSMLKAIIRTEIYKYKDANLFIEDLNEKIVNIFPKGKFASLFYIIIDTNTNIMKYCKASQEPALMLSDNKVIELTTNGQILGAFSKKILKDLLVFEQKEIEFKKGDYLLLYTNGITEAVDSNSNMYGLERLKNNFYENKNDLLKIKNQINNYESDDDLTLLTIWRD